MKTVSRLVLAIVGLFVIAAGWREEKTSPILFLGGAAIIGIGLFSKMQTKNRTRKKPN